MADEHRLDAIFRDVQRGLPRQGPGDEASTLRALRLCTDLPAHANVLDIGCGPGMQTIALAQAFDGHIIAGDLSDEYLAQLGVAATAAGLRDRIEPCRLDMFELPFAPGSFDLIWSEGAAYILGFGEAFARWRHLLRPAGYMAISELVWLTAERPDEVATFFGQEYPAMTDIDANIATIEECGYHVVGHFTLPEAAWWDDYYTPLEAKLPGLRTKYAGDDEAQGLVDMTAREIEMRRRFGDSYGYLFFVAQVADGDAPGASRAREPMTP